MRYSEILNEMILRTNLLPHEGNYILALGAYVWVLDDKLVKDHNTLEDIFEKTGLDAQGEDLIDKAKERPDILTGYINENILYLDATRMSHNPLSSPLVKKVVQQLRLSGVELSSVDYDGNEEDEYHDRSKLVGNIPNIVYHGTCLKYLENIIRQGIRPTDNSNWKNIGKFNGLIFLTAEISMAMYHANKQANENRSVPVVIATRIPDRNLITLDFDVANAFYGDGHNKVSNDYTHSIRNLPYRNNQHGVIQKYSPKTDFTKASGIFAYKGSIPPTFFKGFQTTFSEDEKLSLSDDNKYEFDSVQDMKEAMEKYERYGFYDPDYEPEPDEDEEY